ncbi:MAG: hypothetical protein LBL74_04075 [Bacteroidales bacterium]|jgi:hypothetical protein|nr:hypothetical protein [Bacteroidales bacterium]
MKKVITLAVMAITIGLVSCNDEEENVDRNITPNFIAPNINLNNLPNTSDVSLSVWLDIISKTEGYFMLSETNGKINVKKYQMTKEDGDPDYWSCDRDKFYKWVDGELEKGNVVVITYDKETGCYFGWSGPNTNGDNTIE